METVSNIRIAAIDFDGTLVTDAYPNIGKPNKNTIKYVKHLKKTGWKLILWTCRHGAMLEDAVRFCEKELGLKFDAINDNIPEIVEMYGNNSRKISCDIYIDDRAFVPIEKYENEMRNFNQ